MRKKGKSEAGKKIKRKTGKVNILIDIVHPADINFFKNAIRLLKKKGHAVTITARPRGKLLDILDEELKGMNIPIHIIGTHHKTKIKKIAGIITRSGKLYRFLKKAKPDVVSGFGSFYIAIAARYAGIKSVIFYDDREYRQNYNLCKKFATKFVIPRSVHDKGKNIIQGYDFKELAYLHKKYFRPDKRALKEHNVQAQKYIFVREIKNVSLNYKDDHSILDDVIRDAKKRKLKIVLSLEDKSLKDRYSKKCIILEEPVNDIYSLMYYAKYVITSGDTVAREGALLGRPSIYTGKRRMRVNLPLIRQKLLKATRNISKIPKPQDFDNTKYIDTTKKIMELILDE